SFNWLRNPGRRFHSGGLRNGSLKLLPAKPCVEELEQRELLDASIGTKPLIRHLGPAAVFDQSQFVSGLYYDFLHRHPQQAELTGWTSALYAGASRAQVVQGFLTSDEYRTNLIRQDYQVFLGRDADASGMQAWLNGLRRGATAQDLMTGFVTSSEYYQ